MSSTSSLRFYHFCLQGLFEGAFTLTAFNYALESKMQITVLYLQSVHVSLFSKTRSSFSVQATVVLITAVGVKLLHSTSHCSSLSSVCRRSGESSGCMQKLSTPLKKMSGVGYVSAFIAG